jgi:chemotaxis signal transduction protein
VNRAGVPFPRTGRASAMRVEFDSAFARPPSRPEGSLEDVLALRLRDERCVLRLRDLAGVIAHPLITAVPTLAPALLGVIGSRGSVVAAYDLCVLRGGPATIPRWLVISAAEPTVGVTFEHFDGYRRITSGSPDSGRLIELAAVVESIRALVPGGQHGTAQHVTHHPQFRSGD